MDRRVTTEDLRKKFRNQFDLVNYAIKLAENMILTGRAARVGVDAESRALQVLEEISAGKDAFDEIPKEPDFDDAESELQEARDQGKFSAGTKRKAEKSHKKAARALL